MVFASQRIQNREQYEFALARIYELSSCDELSDRASVELQALSSMVEIFEESTPAYSDPLHSSQL